MKCVNLESCGHQYLDNYTIPYNYSRFRSTLFLGVTTYQSGKKLEPKLSIKDHLKKSLH